MYGKDLQGLSAQERRAHQANKEVLRIAAEIDKRRQKKLDGYQMPSGYEDEEGRIDTKKRDKLLETRATSGMGEDGEGSAGRHGFVGSEQDALEAQQDMIEAQLTTCYLLLKNY